MCRHYNQFNHGIRQFPITAVSNQISLIPHLEETSIFLLLQYFCSKTQFRVLSRPGFCCICLQWFDDGFHLGYLDHKHVKFYLCERHLTIARDYFSKKVNCGHTLGPFVTPPKLSFLCHTNGVVTKRLQVNFWIINDLSYSKGKPINDSILKDEISLKHATVDKAISFFQQLKKGFYLSKTDIENAFRLIVALSQWNLSEIFWENRFHMSTRLPMRVGDQVLVFSKLCQMLQNELLKICMNFHICFIFQMISYQQNLGLKRGRAFH